ncbi:Hypothetical protein BN2458_PEG0978 [Helicobacter typhlonius]|uniref:Uncharacterized protein n=1 Tax=Helicobacter typhlonius TaxID=76936 RepID=A0A0S4PVZ6_9HELI|nr:Hypothetical protein BN2458_PEG0978 [Helicobacter typhlonius]
MKIYLRDKREKRESRKMQRFSQNKQERFIPQKGHILMRTC